MPLSDDTAQTLCAAATKPREAWSTKELTPHTRYAVLIFCAMAMQDEMHWFDWARRNHMIVEACHHFAKIVEQVPLNVAQGFLCPPYGRKPLRGTAAHPPWADGHVS